MKFPGKLKLNVLTAEIYHETNTFSCRKTGEKEFRDRYLLFGADAIAERGQVNTELAGFLKIGRDHGWQVNHLLSASAGPGGKVTRGAFETLCEPITTTAGQDHYDGILLGLHGAMVTEFCEDGEGELLQRLRNLVGPDIPIAMTLDLHANVSATMCSLCDIFVSYKTYPHIDMREVGLQAGEILHRAMTGEINPRTIRIPLAMLEEVNGGRTDTGPMIERISMARDYEAQNDVFAVSINAGFAQADIVEVGPTVLVTGQGDFDAHTEFAETVARDIWESRHQVLNNYLSVQAAAEMAANYNRKHGPLIIADYADNPGGGGYGDSTNLLRALLEIKSTDTCFGPMVDGDTVQLLHSARIGDRVNISLGGKTDPTFGGSPLNLNVKLVSISNGQYVGDGSMIGGLCGSFGPSAVVRIEGIEILVVTIPEQILDLQQFKAFGIEPEEKRVVALKSMQHFRAAFAPIAGEIIVCDSEALCTLQYERLGYQNVPRPIFPLDQ